MIRSEIGIIRKDLHALEEVFRFCANPALFSVSDKWIVANSGILKPVSPGYPVVSCYRPDYNLPCHRPNVSLAGKGWCCGSLCFCAISVYS